MALTEFRSIDGSGNNLAHPELNKAGAPIDRIGPAHYADGISIPIEGVNPRTVSNIVVGQGDAETPNKFGYSGMMYAFGQFVDHDRDLTPSDGVHDISIHVPAGDPTLPDGSIIPLTRVQVEAGTGGGTHTPATPVNAITGWLDLSQVYGSSSEKLASLKAADGMHLATSAGNNLPIGPDGQFMAGDVRAAENPDLTALQTLFMREHNFQADQLHAQHPDWTPDQVFENARAINIGEYEHIVFDEFLPKLVGKHGIPTYHGYDANADVTVSAEFAGAAFRFGHSIVSNEISKVDNAGHLTESTDLLDSFFVPPAAFEANGGADALLRHLTDDVHPALDVRIVDSLRNFLADPPAAIDLASTNIQRGHDMGLGTLNDTRMALGLQPYHNFEQITTDKATVEAMKVAYGNDINKVDLWTGGLAEKSGPPGQGGELGQTFGAIVAQDFAGVRDGDRFWYEKALDTKIVSQIKATTLGDLMLHDTDTTASFLKPHTDVFKSLDTTQSVADHHHHGSHGMGHPAQAALEHFHHFDLL
jgi:peroxidase